MTDAITPRCDHPADAPVLAAFELNPLRCHALWCPRCREWFRLSADRPYDPVHVNAPRA